MDDTDLKPPECIECGSTMIKKIFWHWDIDQINEIIWLCPDCSYEEEFN